MLLSFSTTIGAKAAKTAEASVAATSTSGEKFIILSLLLQKIMRIDEVVRG
jgi:hypothetical protein